MHSKFFIMKTKYMTLINKTIVVRKLGLVSWTTTSKYMLEFTKCRNDSTIDELWLVEHPPVFTRGRSSTNEKLLSLNTNNIPIMQSDRGGKLTYHGPGQQVVYILIDLKRRKINIHQLINIIQNTVINTLGYFNVKANTFFKAPGVYIKKKNLFFRFTYY